MRLQAEPLDDLRRLEVSHEPQCMLGRAKRAFTCKEEKPVSRAFLVDRGDARRRLDRVLLDRLPQSDGLAHAAATLD